MEHILDKLFETVVLRKQSEPDPDDKSYTCYLFAQGQDKILKKCGEECAEMIIAAKNNDKKEMSLEIADLLYHILVLCAEKNLPLSDVWAVLEERHQKTGNLKTPKNFSKNE